MAVAPSDLSLIERLIKARGAATVYADLTEGQRRSLRFAWDAWARPKQKAPGTPGSFSQRTDWRWWLLLAGRAFGKTRTAGEEVRRRVAMGYKRIALVGRTTADVRDVIVKGESGVLNCFPPHQRPLYEPSMRQIKFHTGAIATTYSAEKPDQLRGPQHDFALCDEMAAWRYEAAFKNLEMGLRLGPNPQGVIATTPRPIVECPQLGRLLERANRDVVVVTGSTFENLGNLPGNFIESIKAEYEGTPLGQQELYAVILNAIEGALWTHESINYQEVEDWESELERIVIAVDPAGTAHKKSDMTGIVACGRGVDKRGYVLADLTLKAQPENWARAAVNAYHAWNADCIIAEANHGGDMVAAVIRAIDRNVPVKLVHARKGKLTRAEPVSTLYARRRIFHVRAFPELEAQMTAYAPGKYKGSPDRMDAMVYGMHDLMITRNESASVGVTVIG